MAEFSEKEVTERKSPNPQQIASTSGYGTSDYKPGNISGNTAKQTKNQSHEREIHRNHKKCFPETKKLSLKRGERRMKGDLVWLKLEAAGHVMSRGFCEWAGLSERATRVRKRIWSCGWEDCDQILERDWLEANLSSIWVSFRIWDSGRGCGPAVRTWFVVELCWDVAVVRPARDGPHHLNSNFYFLKKLMLFSSWK